ncbi:asparagine synthase (glutamine-hydrolyzing) [Amycolatopsis azurea]|nr:asparagine synthase (glutamine-hydrolyzing) [Amycolatopsis azurea]
MLTVTTEQRQATAGVRVMCGIAGWVDWQRDLSNERRVLEGMTETLAPRGPDGAGIWLSERAAFGHRRLAVVDLAGGAQPMVASRHETESPVVTFNGEIYNFRELRTELAGRGHEFHTRSDTEVLLRAYLEWGPRCVDRFTGMFAFGIWDPHQRSLLLARDRLGVKPLFYLPYDGGVVFGSELKTLLAHPLVRPRVRAEGLAEMLCFTHTPGAGVFEDVRAVRAGHQVLVSGAGCTETPYWRLESRPHEDDLPATVHKVRSLLGEAVEQQLVADVEVGTLLSGGLDSSTVTALAAGAKSRAGTLITCSVDFQGADEYFRPNTVRPERDAEFARQVSEHVGSRHLEVVLTPEDVSLARSEALQARDLPGFGDINAAQCLMFRELKKHVTVALSGESADESFGGYQWFTPAGGLDAPAFPWTGNVPAIESVLAPELRKRLRMREYVADRYADALAEVPAVEGESAADASIRRMFHLNITRWLGVLLNFTDRMSMREGLEVRVPFCDHRLVEYLWNTPWAMKTAGGRVKGLLTDAAADLLPEAVLKRKKTSFPVDPHPGYERLLRGQLRDELADPGSRLAPLLDPVATVGLLERSRPATGVWRQVDTISFWLQTAEWMRSHQVTVDV